MVALWFNLLTVFGNFVAGIKSCVFMAVKALGVCSCKSESLSKMMFALKVKRVSHEEFYGCMIIFIFCMYSNEVSYFCFHCFG